MDPVVLDLLRKIQKYGYKAFVVGGFVRDLNLGLSQNKDIDITTDAPVDKLLEIFSDYSPKVFKYNTIKFKVDHYYIDIAHFREEFIVDGCNVVELTDDIIKDSKRRDFTINSIYMDCNGEYFDPNKGLDDLKNRIIRFIGNPVQRLNEDPSRLLRFIYFYSKYDLNYISEDVEAIKSISNEIIKKCDKALFDKYISKVKKSCNKEKFNNIICTLDLQDFLSNLN